MNLLEKATSGRITRAQRIVIYAPEGFGKSTLASEFPDPFFLDVEDSTAQLDVRRLGSDVLTSLSVVEKAAHEIVTSKACKTLVVDTVDWLETLALADIIEDAKSSDIKGIEDFGYGKGFTKLRERMTYTLAKLDEAIRAGIHVVLLAHAKIVKFEPPDGAGAYDRYELKLTKQVAPLVKEWADMLLFGNWRTQIVEKGKGDATKYKGIGGRQREMYCNRCSAWDAKNRHGLPDVAPWGIETIKSAIAAPVIEAKEPAPVEQPPTQAGPTTPNRLPDLAAVMKGHEDAVNAFLVRSGKIKQGQTWEDVSSDYAARILANREGFLAAVAKGAK